MIGLENVEDQYNQSLEQIRLARDRSQVSIQRLTAIIQFLNKITASYNKSMKKQGPITLDQFVHIMSKSSGPLAPGIPGSIFNDICFSINFVESIQKEINENHKYVTDWLLPELTNYLNTFTKNIETQIDLYFTQLNVRNQALQRMLQSKQQCDSLYKQVTKAFQKYNSLKFSPNPKIERQLFEDLKRSTLQYQSCITNTLTLTQTFNDEHRELLNVSHNVLKNIYEDEKRRVIWLRKTLREFSNATVSTTNQLITFSNAGDFKAEFINYLTITGITRRTTPMSLFKPIKVADDTFPAPRFLRIPYNLPTPMFVVKAKCNFHGENPNELSFKKGQYISLYENPVNTWCLASLENNKKLGYVPSEAVEAIDMPTAITLNTTLSKTENDLITVPGMLVIVLEKGQEQCLCQDLFGNKGMIDTSILVFENQDD